MKQIVKSIAKNHCGVPFLPPLERLIHATLTDGIKPPEAEGGMARLRKHYLDWNETRAAWRAEVARVLEPLPDADDRAMRMKNMLNRLFELRGAMDLSWLAETKPAEARRYLIDFDSDIPRSVIALVLFELCPGTAIPLSPGGLKKARKLSLLGRSGTKGQMQKLLAEECTQVEAAEVVYYLEYVATAPKAVRRAGKAKRLDPKAAKLKAVADLKEAVKKAATEKAASQKVAKKKFAAKKF